MLFCFDRQRLILTRKYWTAHSESRSLTAVYLHIFKVASLWEDYMLSSCMTLLNTTAVEMHLCHLLFMYTQLHLKIPSAARREDGDPLKNMFTVSRLPSYCSWSGPVGPDDTGAAFRIRAQLGKSSLVETDPRAPGGSVTGRPQWSEEQEAHECDHNLNSYSHR